MNSAITTATNTSVNISSPMNIYAVRWNSLDNVEKKKLLQRPAQLQNAERAKQVTQIIDSVRANGDAALLDFTRQFDKVNLSSLKVTKDEIKAAYKQISPSVLDSLKEAIRRVNLFHQAQVPRAIDIETSPGVRCERRFLPIQRVGLYIPGGTAPLPSTVIMLGVPAQIAGCETRILVTPPGGAGKAQSNSNTDINHKDATIAPSILVAADLLNIQDIYKTGGAQAIAALAYGTQTIPKVDKIFGPGNAWVTEAKLQVSQDPEGAICDMPAGPSEVMVIADSSANPVFVAADLLSQAEHGSDSQVLLISDSTAFIELVRSELVRQLDLLPRKAIASDALSHSLLIEVAKIEEAIEICNSYAPEHLIIQVKNSRQYAEKIRNAGSVFIGPWTPESVGDYASGTNHVLPTYGFAKVLGGVSTESFMKSISFQELSREGLRTIGPVVETLASTECLDAHKNAVSFRLQDSTLVDGA